MECINCGQNNPPEARFCANCGTALIVPPEMSSSAVEAGLAQAPLILPAEHIGFVTRLGAAAIDLLIIVIVSSVFLFDLRHIVYLPGSPWLLISWLYFWLFTGLNRGQTPGKMAFQVKVVKANGETPGLGYAALREIFGKTISFIILFLGFIWIIWDDKKQGWHDKIAETCVVKTKPKSIGG